jgi:hypothetical protein
MATGVATAAIHHAATRLAFDPVMQIPQARFPQYRRSASADSRNGVAQVSRRNEP